MSRSRMFLALFCAALLFTFVMAVLPHPPRIPGNPKDKLQHIAAFLTLTALAIPAFPRARWFHLLIGLSGFGALIELVQAIPALHRDADLIDWLADTAAILAVLGIRRLRAPLREKQR